MFGCGGGARDRLWAGKRMVVSAITASAYCNLCTVSGAKVFRLSLELQHIKVDNLLPVLDFRLG